MDQQYEKDHLQSVIEGLTYTTADERRNKPNPSKIPFEGNARNNLASYKDAVVRYARFLAGQMGETDDNFVQVRSASATEKLDDGIIENVEQKLSLERDMQAALRRDIKKLGSTLAIVDDGAERSVDTGFIDITCEDRSDGALVVVELKACKADSRAIGQILGYMGDLSSEEGDRQVRGVLVAHEFDKRTISAARAVSSLVLMRYSVEFRFEPES